MLQNICHKLCKNRLKKPGDPVFKLCQLHSNIHSQFLIAWKNYFGIYINNLSEKFSLKKSLKALIVMLIILLTLIMCARWNLNSTIRNEKIIHLLLPKIRKLLAVITTRLVGMRTARSMQTRINSHSLWNPSGRKARYDTIGITIQL